MESTGKKRGKIQQLISVVYLLFWIDSFDMSLSFVVPFIQANLITNISSIYNMLILMRWIWIKKMPLLMHETASTTQNVSNHYHNFKLIDKVLMLFDLLFHTKSVSTPYRPYYFILNSHNFSRLAYQTEKKFVYVFVPLKDKRFQIDFTEL